MIILMVSSYAIQKSFKVVFVSMLQFATFVGELSHGMFIIISNIIIVVLDADLY